VIHIDLSKCTGCRRCETACAFFHTGRINNHLARIKVEHIYEIGIDGPVVCQQCQERYCLKCPVDALSIGEYGQVIVSPTICTLCGACEKNCPIGAIEQFNGFVFVCDLCGGDPKCVAACTENAITWEKENIARSSFAELHKKTRSMNPSEKRHYFVETLGTDVRAKWRENRG